ncbi:hypothetical protein RHMOL_Rhmol07G0105400 [Rhododendron molle]|uniref:Uncharacterized protein n=1 Tax=Rhododendron molle TaxID=49168 RepID=A0ACC0MZW6_RHOML|nr:hypothetical protein RHMOL_Rhmol07G0105400 [Rhododendron molle]
MHKLLTPDINAKSMSCVSSLPFQIPNAQLNNQCFSMSEFTGTGGDGDLQAVVRGFNNCFSPCSTILDYPQTCFSPLVVQEEDVLFSSFPDLFFESNTVVFDELEQLYKPFYPASSQLSPQTSLSPSVSDHEERGANRVQEKEAFPESAIVVAAAAAAAASPLPVKYKRRKTQHKRVVVEVAAEGLSSDVWAWRKYGQKPIKGSPHPRSYYRCSSLKGCLARKQVERSQSDPQMFVITYTAEHCHGHPIRRSSLAGTTRHKFSLSKSPTTSNPDASISTDSGSCSLSPPVTPVLAMKVEDGQRISDIEASKSNVGLDNMCDVMSFDDLFLGFDELDRFNF